MNECGFWLQTAAFSGAETFFGERGRDSPQVVE
jgi:hypothetical protein